MTNFPSLIVFGPLNTCLSAEELRELRNSLLSYEQLDCVKEAVSGLPDLWKTLLENDASLEPVYGLAAAEQLAAWVLTGDTPCNSVTWNSALSFSLTIVSHLCDYLTYLRETGYAHPSILNRVIKDGGVQGFCAGLLSAIAVANSIDDESIGLHGALSVRLAFSIGAYVDLDSIRHGPTSCLAVRWKPPDSISTVENLLDKHDTAYVSVIRSMNEATITVLSSSVSDVSKHLSQEAICVLDTGLRGRYHTHDYRGVPEKVINSCKQHAFPSDTDANIFSLDQDEVMAASRDILLERSNWPLALSKAASRLTEIDREVFVLSIGPDSVLSSLPRNVSIVRMSRISNTRSASKQVQEEQEYPKDAIAMTGMSCKLPGADSPDEFWDLLMQGKSMVEHVPLDRWSEESSSRGNGIRRYWGNFMRDIDSFDHRFFKRSSREAASMDPQQRLLLQGAYEAMESAGYFFSSPTTRNRDVGCYLGLCAVEYDANVGSHNPNAFSTPGTLRAFLSGKISHFFGWTGPSLTFDTACSSSAVAIHTACRALQTGECTQALAGGVSLFTSPYLYENLSASHFLSPTGATKPFDAKADGYCRGEGLGLVVLKKLSTAKADGDTILAVVGGSAVNQNDNCAPITVPNARSQQSLYQKAAQEAGIIPHQVSFVESHGTGTPVGDPIEMESIRHTFGGPRRRNNLMVSSVKGNIGHLEGASGVAGLIKTILQLEHRTVVMQASFQSLNPKIPPLGPDRLTVPTTNISLPDGFLTACVNNYGAAGSNCTLMIMQRPRTSEPDTQLSSLSRYPIMIASNSEGSIWEYCKALRENIRQRPDKERLIGSIAFHLARRHNRSLPYIFVTTVTDMLTLEKELAGQLTAPTSFTGRRPPCPSTILVCGGQVRKYVGLSKPLWEQFAILRRHLDACDETLRSLGYPGLYPAIFQEEPIPDLVILHSAIFALQYASAKAWMDCGLAVDAVIGHSLGQLSALSVSGILSLEDGLRFVAGRASLMKTNWGQEAGSMILVEANLETLSELRHSFEVACYNGPSSHVLVGDKVSIDELEENMAQKKLKFKRLQVTNGFHSKFTDPLIAPLRELASSLRFRKPSVHIETCSDGSSWSNPTADLLAKHTRDPVFFGQAVQRLASSRGACTWLEAGSDSGAISMVRRALDISKIREHEFFPISHSKPSALNTVVDTTLQLWKRGHSPQFWAFHPLQKSQYDPLRLPTYQWEKNKHWLDLMPPIQPSAALNSQEPPDVESKTPHLVELVQRNYEDAVFKIGTACDEYQRFVSGHIIAGSPLCPATLYMEMVARACKMLLPWEPASLPGFSDIQIDSPLGMADDREITMTLHARTNQSWEFNVSSHVKGSPQSGTVSHTSGIIELRTDVEPVNQELLHYERLIGTDAVEALYEDPESESVRGPMLYKIFSRVVQYSSPYQRLKSVAAKMGRIAGTVTSSPEFTSDTVLTQPPTIDSWMQVAGIHVNCIRPCPEDEAYVFTKLERIQFGPGFTPPSLAASTSWNIFSNLVPSGPKKLLNDIFVFDAASKRLVVLILGAQFDKVGLKTLQKVVSRLNKGTDNACRRPEHSPQSEFHIPFSDCKASLTESAPIPEPVTSKPSTALDHTLVFNDICVLLERVAEVPRDDIRGNTPFDNLGIDSLMMMEVVSEISRHFAIDLSSEDMEPLTDLDSLISYLLKKRDGAKMDLVSSSSPTTIAMTQSSSPSLTASATTRNDEISPSTHLHESQKIEQLASLLQEHLELTSAPSSDANLAAMGLDSLLAIELQNDIEKLFSVSIDLYQLDETSSFQDLVRLAGLGQASFQTAADDFRVSNHSAGLVRDAKPPSSTPEPLTQTLHATDLREMFDQIRLDFDKFSEEEGFADFWRSVYPNQKRLVLSYTAEAFKELGSDLACISAGRTLPKLSVLEKHKCLLERMYEISADGGYIDWQQSLGYTRTSKPFDIAAPQELLRGIVSDFPLHASEHRLLDVTGSKLAECLTGKVDPLSLLFANNKNRQILADVYDLSPMCRAITQLLAKFMARAFTPKCESDMFHFLEVGGGTGGTTKFLVEYLTRCGLNFTYTFTDISSALVGSMKKTLAKYDCMRYATLDVEKDAPPEFIASYHAIISTNCIHATRNATLTLANLRSMLLPGGMMALVEFTTGLYWFDLVYGLLEGWWLFSDGRRHALADASFWKSSLVAAGYQEVKWTDGDTRESRTLQLFCGFNPTADRDEDSRLSKRAGVSLETVTWKHVDSLDLCADIYYPSPEERNAVTTKRPVALLFHGGGHVSLTRKDIPLKHMKTLLKRGFLPISVDYRLCPEINLSQGPMTDACDALAWVRSKLPYLERARQDVQLDADRVAAVGWSSGGHLAMTLAYTAPERDLKAPDVVLAFYCPSNFEAEWWQSPTYPKNVLESPDTKYDLQEGIRERPIVGYKSSSAIGASMTLKDPRWRIVIHYNWKAQIVPVLVYGLPSKAKDTNKNANSNDTSYWESLPMPPAEDIQAVSPYAQIIQGRYRTPTFLVHGNRDDLIPWQQSRDTVEALNAQGIEAGFATPHGAGHAFDLWPDEDPHGTGWTAVKRAYDFVCQHIS